MTLMAKKDKAGVHGDGVAGRRRIDAMMGVDEDVGLRRRSSIR